MRSHHKSKIYHIQVGLFILLSILKPMEFNLDGTFYMHE
jgi:hypothetical protein